MGVTRLGLIALAVLFASLTVRSEGFQELLDRRWLPVKTDKNVTIGELGKVFSDVTGSNVYVQPAVAEQKLRMDLATIKGSLREVLNVVAAQARLTWKVTAGAIVIGSREDIAHIERRVARIKTFGHAAFERTVNVELEAATIGELVAVLKAATEVELTGDKLETEITLKVRDMAVADILALVLPAEWRVMEKRRGGFHLAAPERLTFDYKNQPARKVVEVIGTFIRRKVVLDGEFGGEVVSLKLMKVEWPEGLRRLARVLGAEARPTVDGSWRIARAWRFAVEKGLLSKVTIAAQGRTLGEILLAGSPVPIALDSGLASRVIDLKVKNVTFAQALTLATEPQGLAWDIRWGVVFVTTPKRMNTLRRFPILPKLPKKDLRLPFHNTSLPRARDYLAAATGMKIVIDAKAKEAFEAGEITLKGEVDLRHALTVFTQPHGLRVITERGALVIQKQPR